MYLRYRIAYNFATLVVASVGDHATYGKLAAGFNALWSNERPGIPPLEERLEHFLWDDVLWCR